MSELATPGPKKGKMLPLLLGLAGAGLLGAVPFMPCIPD